MVSEYPYRTGWTDWVLFKIASKKGPDDRIIPPADACASSEALIAWLKALRYDFWAKDKYLTAGFLMNKEPPEFIELRRHPQSEGRRCFGVCENTEAWVYRLLHSKKAHSLLALTRSGQFEFLPKHVKLKDEQNYPTLNIEVVDCAEDWLELSIRQAIAGPHNEHESRYWTGKPVMSRIRQIYAEHLNRHNRQVWELKKELGGVAASPSDEEMSEGSEEYDYQRIADQFDLTEKAAVKLFSQACRYDDTRKAHQAFSEFVARYHAIEQQMASLSIQESLKDAITQALHSGEAEKAEQLLKQSGA